MIKTVDLIKWIDKMSVDKSNTVPNGFIRGQDLHDLAKIIKKNEPKNFELSMLGDKFPWKV